MVTVASKNILLSVNLGTDDTPDWKLVACTTADGFSASTDTVAIATKCNGGYIDNQPGAKNWSFSASAYVEKDPGPTFATQDELFELWADDVITDWKLESIDTDYAYLRKGKGYISDLSETSDEGDFLAFDITITGSGTVTNAETT